MSVRTTAPLYLSAIIILGAFAVAPCVSPVLAGQQQTGEVLYTCVMDPDVKSKKPGNCPRCGMSLRVARPESAPAGRSSGEEPKLAAEDGMKLQKIPDVVVQDQNGRQLNFYSDLIKGKTVAINFLFTTCTTICPPLAATFRKVQVEMGERVGRDVHLISISVDPVIDVPQRLKAFAAKFKAGEGWTFVTGDRAEIDRLLKALGAAVADKNDHTPMLVIGNDEAQYWTRTYGLAPASSIVQVIKDAAAKSGE
jgi:cytochrome oxidase Cu insertion factor (SCO1/SenC/PrrC family)